MGAKRFLSMAQSTLPFVAHIEEEMNDFTNTISRVMVTSAMLCAVSGVAQTVQHYKQTNLVADTPGVAAVTDPNLVNPWGLSRSSGSPWWVSDNGTGMSTLYDGSGNIVPLVVTIPNFDTKHPAPGTPTGTIFNGTSNFALAPGKPAIFLFATEDGTVSGWNPGVNASTATIKVNLYGNGVFKGMTMATASVTPGNPQPYLYVADFRKNIVRVLDTNFNGVGELEARFYDKMIPAGYAPFNVQNIGGNLYVSFAMQDSEKHDEVDGAGLGYVDVFTPEGRLLQRLQHGPWMNAPWGMVQAPTDFGQYSHDILVGQFGSGEILAFNPINGAFLGKLLDTTGATLHIDGLWGLGFGNDGKAGPATTLYFSAGPDGEQHGLLGTLTAVENTQGNDR